MANLTAPGPAAQSDSLRARKKHRTRQLLLDTAVYLFAQRGFDPVTLEDIAAACEVSRGTVFNYFPYKELLVLEYLDPRWAALMAPIEAAFGGGGEPVDLLVRALALPAAAAREHPAFVRILARELVHPSALRAERAERSLAYLPLVVKLVEAGQAAGAIREDVTALDVGPFLAESALATIARHAGAGGEEALAVCREVALRGITARDARQPGEAPDDVLRAAAHHRDADNT